MRNFEYTPTGVCSKKMKFEIENNIIKNIDVIGGCHGNLQGIRALCIGESIDKVIEKLKGIKCGFKNTSCPDQLAIALEKYKQQENI